ncbi:STY0301 family protein [Inhella sp.]|uniref:STY0301 family protein n=1 Tax=Inhella sp. TaxID=1921806 RepID=UPI0035AF137B
MLLIAQVALLSGGASAQSCPMQLDEITVRSIHKNWVVKGKPIVGATLSGMGIIEGPLEGGNGVPPGYLLPELEEDRIVWRLEYRDRSQEYWFQCVYQKLSISRRLLPEINFCDGGVQVIDARGRKAIRPLGRCE